MREVKSFNQFIDNVHWWGEAVGIYSESTEAHQQAKFLEEAGEYLTAETKDEFEDAIGDMAVCIVNAAKFKYINLMHINFNEICYEGNLNSVVVEVINKDYFNAIEYLYSLSSNKHNFNFITCLEKSWKVIEKRVGNGMMVNKKFVKRENLTEEQKQQLDNNLKV